jgi:hypothetical protein
MKRLIQFAAVLTIALMAGSPVAEALACSTLMGEGTAACPMGMSEMGPDCPMAQQMAGDGCAQECCNHALPLMPTPLLIPVKPRIASPSQFIALILASPDAEQSAIAKSKGPPPSISPPRYILNRVFRI